MRNVSGQVKMSGSEIKANMNTGNKIFGKHMRQFLHKNNEYGVLVVQNGIVVVKNNGKER